MNLKAKFRFNTAGQGCFYSGNIKIERHQSFNFIYDCGTLSNRKFIKAEIDKYSERLKDVNSGILDLLIISHLDSDHINQIKYLLGRINSCKLAIMPYVYPAERLQIYLSSKHKDEDGISDSDYYEFLINPAGYLLGSGKVDQVLFFTSGDTGIDEAPPDNTPVPFDNVEEFNRDVYRVSKDFKKSKVSEIDSIDDLEGKDTIKELVGNGKVLFASHNQKIFVGAFWEFYFFCKSQSNASIEDFKNLVKKRVKGLKLSDRLNKGDLTTILGSKNLPKVKEAFKKKFKDFNSTGLICYHRPMNLIDFYSNLYKIKRKKKSHCLYNYWNEYIHNATLLLADFNLNEVLPKYVVNNFSTVLVFQIPHHGSRKNWTLRFMNNLIDCCYSVINFGYGNKYGHPSSEVIEDLRHRDFKPRYCFNTQFSGLEYTHMVVLSDSKIIKGVNFII